MMTAAPEMADKFQMTFRQSGHAANDRAGNFAAHTSIVGETLSGRQIGMRVAPVPFPLCVFAGD